MRRLPSPRIDKQVKIPTDLYFIETQCAERFIKIGISSDAHTRASKMQMDCPYELKLLKLVPGGAHMEYELHARFAADRVRGEWFRRTPELVALIDGLEGRDTLRPPPPFYEFDLPPLLSSLSTELSGEAVTALPQPVPS